ncbi:IS1 family transposase [Sphingomonas sp. CJ99]
MILTALCEGMSIRACSRTFRVSFKSVLRLVREVGDMAISFHNESGTVTPREIQADEIWSFVGRNDRGYAPEDKVPNEGVTWTWLAIDPETQLVLTYHIGTRGAVDATPFMRKVARRLARNEHGELLVRPSLAVDGHPVYPDAIELAFGAEVDAGVFEKVYDEKKRYIGSKRKQLKGAPRYEEINTWRIERENGFLRQANRRFTRKTNAFSKRLIYHERQVAIWMLYRNYCWSRKIDPNDPKREVSAAMSAGLTDRVWREEEIIERSDAYKKTRETAAPVGLEQGESDLREKPFWLNHCPQHKRAKVHSSDCSTVRKAMARGDEASTTSVWLNFATEEDAVAVAEKKEPDTHSKCRLCLGGYVTRSTYGKRR